MNSYKAGGAHQGAGASSGKKGNLEEALFCRSKKARTATCCCAKAGGTSFKRVRYGIRQRRFCFIAPERPRLVRRVFSVHRQERGIDGVEESQPRPRRRSLNAKDHRRIQIHNNFSQRPATSALANDASVFSTKVVSLEVKGSRLILYFNACAFVTASAAAHAAPISFADRRTFLS